MERTLEQARDRSQILRVAAFGAFFLSGASSLVFQTLWSRLLSHVFGSSSIAVSSVVSVFMAGLGLGAYAFGRRADRLRDPLRLYALAETSVGCIALCVPYLLKSDGWLAHVNAVLRSQLGAASVWFLLARFACIVPILIVPTTLMGSTLPLLARHFVAAHSDAGEASRTVGRLYAINTAGAVFGVFASSFILMPRFGVSVANAVAAGTNFALALLILALRRLHKPAAAEPQPDAEPESSQQLPAALRRAAALAFAASGFSSLLYEVVWSRALVNTIGGSLYSFSLILTTFLVGIAGGSALLSALLAGRVQPLKLAAVGGAALCLLTLAPWGVHLGGVAGAVILLVTLAGVLVGFAFGRGYAARIALFTGQDAAMLEHKPAFWLLGLPGAAALAALVQRSDRLSAITFAVVVAGSAFLLILIVLVRRPLATLIALHLFIACSTLMSAVFADELSLTFASMVAPLYHDLADHVGTVQGFMFLTAALCVLPSALGMGAVFPATLRLWTAGGGQIGRDVGVVYAGNTVGSILGAWLPGFVLMPALGMQPTLHVGMAWNLTTALGLAWIGAHYAGRRSRERKALTLTAAGVPWAIALLAFFTVRESEFLTWSISKMTLGAFRISLAREVLDREAWGAPDLVYYRDGLSTTVTVERWGRHYSLKNNGKVDASNGDDMPTQIMVAAIPMLMHAREPEAIDAAIVGFGSGVTVGTALRFPVRSIEVIELERSTVEASRFFADVNHLDYALDHFPYVSEPRLSVLADDGRNYLAATPKHYDVIISEPSNPWLTGVSDLFTQDHFRVAKKKLKPDGIYCQWAQLYELSPDNVKTLYRTFAANFRYVVVFSAEDISSDTLMIGSESPLPLDLARVRRTFDRPGVARELERAYVHTPEDVIARVLLASREEVLKFTAGATINTDDNARIELRAPRDLIGFERYKGYLETMYAPDWPYGRVLSRLQGFGSGPAAANSYAHLVMSLLSHGRKAEISGILARAHAEASTPELELAQSVYVSLTAAQELEPGLELDGDPTPQSDDEPALKLLHEAFARAQQQLEQHRFATALAQVEALPSRLRRSAGPAWDLYEGYLHYKAGEHEEAATLFEDVLRAHDDFARTHPSLYYYLARAHDAQRHFDKAVRNMRAYVLQANASARPVAATAERSPAH